jgi:arylsulfatase A-like enzyme
MTSRGAAAFLVLASVLACEAPPTLHHSSTDVMWVTFCTLRADHLGAYGYDQPTSPHFDELARRGVLFERVLAPAPWTRPSIAAMSTGVHPRALGVTGPAESLQLALPESADTLAERFARAGYTTLGVFANPNVSAAFGFSQGYDFFRAHDVAFSHMKPGQKLTGEQASALLLERVAALAPAQRFFAHLVLIDAHAPYDPKVARSKLAGLRFDGATAGYDLQVRYVDEVLGELVESLEELGRTNTLIVVNADHGEGFEERPDDRGHGQTLYNSSIWVPWLLVHPALESRRVPELVESLDAPATVLDLLGLPSAGMRDARSLARAARGGELPERGFAVTETELMGARRGALLETGWKLIVDRQGAADPELYRYAEDRLELTERAAEHPERVERMAAQLEAWRVERDARAPSDVRRVEPPPGMRARLEALGYIEP